MTRPKQIGEPDIARWLTQSISSITDVPPGEVSETAPFTSLGLDSAAAVSLTGELEDWLGIRLDPTLLYDFTTIKDLSAHLAGQLAEKATVT